MPTAPIRPLLQDPPTIRERWVGARTLVRANLGLTALWASSWAILVGATVTDEIHLGRWGIWCALLALLLSMIRVARWTVTRLTRNICRAVLDVEVPAPRIAAPLYPVRDSSLTHTTDTPVV